MKEDQTETMPSRRYRKYYTYIEPVISDPVIRGYFTLVASLLLTAFFIFFALSPTFSTIVGLFRKIDDQEEIVTELDKKIQNIIQAQENYSLVEDDIPLLSTALPTKPVPQTVLLGVLQAATSSGVTITALQLNDVYLTGVNPEVKTNQSPPSKSPTDSLISTLGLPVVGFVVAVDGSEEEIRAFAGELEKLPRIIALSSVSLRKSVESSGSDLLSADIAASAFYYPETIQSVTDQSVTEPNENQ